MTVELAKSQQTILFVVNPLNPRVKALSFGTVYYAVQGAELKLLNLDLVISYH